MDQLICPECNQAAGFNICDSGVGSNYSVSADREVRSEDCVPLEAVIDITCLACEAEPKGDLWDEIYALYCG